MNPADIARNTNIPSILDSILYLGNPVTTSIPNSNDTVNVNIVHMINAYCIIVSCVFLFMAYTIIPVNTRTVGITIGADKHTPAITAFNLSDVEERLNLLIK